MMRNRRWDALLGAVIAVAGVAVAQTPSAPTAPTEPTAPMLWRAAYVAPREGHFGAGIEAFAREMARATGGRIRVEHVPDGKAGGELELMRKLRDGELELASISSGPLGNWVPEVRVLDLPYLFLDYAHAHRVLDGPLGQQLLTYFPARGLIALGWTEHGFRHLTNNRRPIVLPEDLRGLTLRTMENKTHQAALGLLGARAQPLPFTELPRALANGSVDGQENPLSIIVSTGIYRSQRYLSLSQHFYSAGILLIAPKVWNALSAADRAAVQQATAAAVAAQRARVLADEFAALAQLQAEGVQVSSYVELPLFRLALRRRYAELLPEVDPALIEALRSAR
jgi:tripartite ATP-independent transporter DctP family solute receptor